MSLIRRHVGPEAAWPAGRRRWPARVEAVVRESAEAYSVSIAETLGPGQSRGPSAARRMAMWRLRAMGFSYPEIGKICGGRHHTSVMQAVCRYVQAQPRVEIRPFNPNAPDYSGEWAI